MLLKGSCCTQKLICSFLLCIFDLTMKQLFNKTPLSLWKAQTVRLIETLVT